MRKRRVRCAMGRDTNHRKWCLKRGAVCNGDHAMNPVPGCATGSCDALIIVVCCLWASFCSTMKACSRFVFLTAVVQMPRLSRVLYRTVLNLSGDSDDVIISSILFLRVAVSVLHLTFCAIFETTTNLLTATTACFLRMASMPAPQML